MSELADMLADSAQRLLGDRAEAAAKSAPGVWQVDLWSEITNLGLPLTLLDEDQGGVGGAWEEAYAVLRPVGEFAIPLPVGEAMLAARVADGAGLAIPSGVATIGAHVDATLRESGGRWRFNGEIRGVPWGRYASSIVTVVQHGERPLVCVVPRDAGLLREGTNLAGEPRDDFSFSAAEVQAAPSAKREAAALFDYCALLRLPSIVGALESALRRSIQYAIQRKQFGRAIGQFQAVQQMLALLAERPLLARQGFKLPRRNCALIKRLGWRPRAPIKCMPPSVLLANTAYIA
jgi:acyl-CoA dehydrogenase